MFGIPGKELVDNGLQGSAELLSRCFAEYMTYHEVIGQPLQDQEQTFMKDVEVNSPKHRYLNFSSSPVRKDGKFVGRVWLVKDITEEKEITELKIEYGGARSAEELKSKFMTVISHQLRTPLSSIRWNSELLMSDDYKDVSEEVKEVLGQVYSSVVSSISIVDDMLLAVDIEQRAIKLKKSAVDIGDIIRKVVHGFEKTAKMHSVTLNLKKLPPEIPRLFLDEDMIEAALGRVVDNAIKYSPEGGEVEIKVLLGQKEITIEVMDHGIGIPEKEQARVFDLFYRSERAIDLNPNASGLGLYICKYIIEAHDGRLAFVSTVGKGTKFILNLPRKPGN